MIRLGSDRNEQIGEFVYAGIYLAYFCFSIEPWMKIIYEGSETNQHLRISPFFATSALVKNLSMKTASWMFKTFSSSGLLFFCSSSCKTANRLARLFSEKGRTIHPVHYKVKEQLWSGNYVPLIKSSPTFIPGSFLMCPILSSPLPSCRKPSPPELPFRARNNQDKHTAAKRNCCVFD